MIIDPLFELQGKSLLENGDYVGAIECFTAGINLDPHVNLFQMRAAAFKNLNMFTEAYYDYSFIIRLEHSIGTHYCSRGLCCAKLKRLSLALEDLDTAVSVSSCRVLLTVDYYHCTFFFYRKMSFLHRLSVSDKLLNQMDPSPLHYYSRATVLSDMGLHDAAVKGTVPVAESAAICNTQIRITMMRDPLKVAYR